MRIKLLTALLFSLSTLVYANDYVPYSWEKNRSRVLLSAKENGFAELILKHHLQLQYTFDKDDFVVYSTLHRIVRVTNDEAIQRNNRIYISMYNVMELIDLQARVINKDGKVVVFDKNNLKEIKDEETGNAYRIFAMEGVETDAEIEYFYTKKMRPSLFDRINIQYETPIKEATFLLTSPSHLKFDFRSYNKFPQVTDASTEANNMYKVSMTDIPALKKETFSYFDANQMRIEYKLAYNLAKSKARLFTWEEAAKTFYGILNTRSKDEEKAIDKFLNTIGDKKSGTLEQRIRNIETTVKTTVQVNENMRTPELGDIQSIIKTKLASKEGMTRLLVGLFEKAGIECHAVITCSRENARFDGDFDSWSFLDEYILYFPATKGYLMPATFEYRYPMIPPDFTAQKGLFVEPFSLGDVKSALAQIKEIPALDYNLTVDNLDVQVTFNDDLSENTIVMKREFGGYNAVYFTPFYALMTEEQRLQMVEELLKQTSPDLKLGKWTAKPVEREAQTNFLIDATFTSSHFIERAGPRILFKVGELIGPQVEMYRDDERMTEVENDYNRGYDRVITVEIPMGYTIKNINDLKLDVQYKDKDGIPYLFQSDYKLISETKLEIVVKEYYKMIFAPIERYEDYRKVINAAADFNKITLVLEKK